MGLRLAAFLHSILKKLGYLLATATVGFAKSREGDAAVLMYHAVDTSGWRLSVTPQEFAWQMKYLKRHRIVVPLADVVAHAKGEKRLPERSVAVTFDDGYADLVSTVLPVITRYRIPITIFLTTDLTEQTNSKALPRISWDEVRLLRASGWVTIESHGKTHPHLPSLSPDEVRTQLVDARTDIERETGVAPSYFAYPFGDRSPEVEAAVLAAGYEAAFSITEGFVQKGSELLHLPRIQVDTTMTHLLYRLRLTPALSQNRRIVDALRRVLKIHSK